jgi:hypothetical protein
MKKKLKIINLLIVIGFVMGCSDQSETENLREFSAVTKNEAIQFLSSRSFKNPNNYIKNVDLDALKSELIANSDQELLVVPVETSDEGYDSRLVMLKIKNEVKAKIVHYLKKDVKTTDFTGEVIFSDLDGRFYAGGWFENNLLTRTYTFNSEVAGKTDSAECRQSCGHSADNEYCVCNTQNLNEVVVVSSKPTPYVSISTIYPQELEGGNSGCEVECGGWPPGGGGTSGSNSTPSCGANEELDSDKKNCVCKEGYTRDSLNKCVKKPCVGDPVANPEIAEQKNSGIKGGMHGTCVRKVKNKICNSVKGRKSHIGVDLKNPFGAPVYAIYGGTITTHTQIDDKGNIIGAGYYSVIVSTINGKTIRMVYYHLQKDNRKTGTVNAGDIIGYQGDSGNLKNGIEQGYTVSHLHIKTQENGINVDPLSHIKTTIDTSTGEVKKTCTE